MACMVREALLKFTRESSAKLIVRSVTETAILVNEVSHSESIALTPDELLGPWHRKPVAKLCVDDFAYILGTGPEIVLLGTGATHAFPPRELTFAFARMGVGFEVMDTAAAARTFNVLANEDRKVVAILCL